jgi:hypothetical protein
MASFGNQPLLDPKDLVRACAESGIPTDRWLGKVNSYVNPRGVYSGQGWILLSRAVLNALSTSKAYDLTLEINSTSVTHKSLMIVNAECVLVGARGDVTAPYLVELADNRRLLLGIPIDVAYNVRSTPGSATYFSATRDSGSDWTWTTLMADLWDAGNVNDDLGDFPGLPYTPSGVPENLSFYGGYWCEAFAAVCERLSISLILNTITDTYSLVRIAATSATQDASLATLDGSRAWDSDFLLPVLTNVPEKVRVRFPKFRPTADFTGGSSWYVLDVADPTAGGPLRGVHPGTVAILTDVLIAQYDGSGTLTNSGALSTRATERATDYFRRIRLEKLYRVYAEQRALQPGEKLQQVRWADRGKVHVTEAGRGQTGLGLEPYGRGKDCCEGATADFAGAAGRFQEDWYILQAFLTGNDVAYYRVSDTTPFVPSGSDSMSGAYYKAIKTFINPATLKSADDPSGVYQWLWGEKNDNVGFALSGLSVSNEAFYALNQYVPAIVDGSYALPSDTFGARDRLLPVVNFAATSPSLGTVTVPDGLDDMGHATSWMTIPLSASADPVQFGGTGGWADTATLRPIGTGMFRTASHLSGGPYFCDWSAFGVLGDLGIGSGIEVGVNTGTDVKVAYYTPHGIRWDSLLHLEGVGSITFGGMVALVDGGTPSGGAGYRLTMGNSGFSNNNIDIIFDPGNIVSAGYGATYGDAVEIFGRHHISLSGTTISFNSSVMPNVVPTFVVAGTQVFFSPGGLTGTFP